ncbi:hypothetical protein CcCBS67573_g08329 [Chytriomyces confervae]|uniref:FERM domain-containing protein n=1 Tax=Chytriomyces confervae TaxID=246404 RepID=A0A507EN17_9FUNG|nr:hypothetical protein CcCBS67573_g08329 [Chytriomyces confervae]
MNPQTLHTIKINAVDQSSTKTLQFSGATFVHDACKEIRTKFGETAGGSDHGLFWPETGKWLHPSKVLDYYDLKTGDLLQFRKKHCPLKVKTLDESVKTVLVDESLNVGKLVLAVCERLGIHNADEYSFALDSGAIEALKRGSPDMLKKPPSTGSTRKMSLTSMLPHLKAKEKKTSSEETKWLNPDMTLREQGVKETDAVLLKKKFFYTDQNIDRNDPIQLNLLFNQAKEMILTGKHPCTLEEAAQFAAIQAQCQFGNHEPDRHKGAHLQLMDFVPSEYRNNRDLTKRIISEHAKLQGLSDLNAKFRYVQLSRSLKTYGITFFLVKEKLDKKAKLADVLLGVTKQSIVRLDAVTKDVIKTWPLTHLRRWAAAANSFTLDFGDYADNYFTVQTSEGDQISQLIAGYIDIILKKKKEAEKVFHEEDEVLTTSEEYVKPVKAANAAILSNGHKQATEIRVGTLMTANNSRAFPKSVPTSLSNEPNFNNPEFNEPLQPLLDTISMDLAVLNNAARDLDNDIQLPPFANDAVSQEWKQTTIETNVDSVSSHLTSHLAYCASVINLFKSDFEGVEPDALIQSVNLITCNCLQMANGIKLLAALTNSLEEKESFKRAAKDVFESAGAYVKATQDVLSQGASKEVVLNSSGNVTVTSSDLLALIGRSDVPDDTQNELQELAKSVSRAVADVINAARKSAEDISDPHDQLQVASNAKLVADACNQLVACTVMVAPVVSSQVCLDQLLSAAEFVKSAALQVCDSCSTATTNESVLESLHESVERVQESIHRLLEKARNCDEVCYEVGPMEKEFEDVIQSIDGIADKCVSADDVLHAAKELTLSNTHYINAMKRVALDTGEEDQDKDKLMSSARTLADLTSQMVLAAKEASKNSDDPRTMSHFHDMVDCIRQVVNDSSGHSMQKKTMVKLGKTVKNLLASQSLLVSAAVAAGPSNRNQVGQIEFNQQVKNVAGSVAALNCSWKCHVLDLDDLVAQNELLREAQKIIPALTALIQSARSITPTIGDSAIQSHVETLIQQTSSDLESVQKSTTTAEEICSTLKLESALCSIKSLQQSIGSSNSKSQSISTTTEPFKVHQNIKTISSSIDTLCEAVMLHDDKSAGISAAEAVFALQAIHLSAAGILATDTDQEEYKNHLSLAATGVAGTLAALIESAKSKKSRETDDEFETSTNRLVAAAKEALLEMELCMPGRKELGKAAAVVDEYSEALTVQKLEMSTASALSYPAAQIQLQNAISCLTESAGALASAAKSSSYELQTSAVSFTADFEQFIEASCALSHSGADDIEADRILSNLGGVCHLSKEFLTSITQVSLDSSSSSLRNELLAKARALAETLTSASEFCIAPAPGFKECKHALDALQQAKTLLSQANETTGGNEDSYGQTLQTIIQLSKKMNGTVTAFLASKNESSVVNYGEMMVELAQTMHAVTESTARAVYLIGISDPSTTPAIPPSINILEFETIAEDITKAFQLLIDPNNNHEVILELAGTIAKQTSKLCGLCKTYGSTAIAISQPSKLKLIQFAKEIALDTAASVPSIKCLALEPTPDALMRVQEASLHLLGTVNRTVAFARSNEFVGAPAKVSPQCAMLQKPILDVTKHLITAVQDLVNAVKQSLLNPNCSDVPTASTKQTKCITETILKFIELVTVHAPGQKECSDAISKLSESIHVLDAAIFDATVDNLESRVGASRDGLVHTVRGLASLVDVISRASCTDVAQLKNAVTELPASLAKMSSLSVSVASALPEKETQLGLLSQAKAVSESVQTLMNAIKNSTVSHTDKASQIEETHASTYSLIQAFISTLEGAHDQSGEFLTATKRIESAASRFETDHLEDTTVCSYPQLVAELEQTCKGLVEKVGDVLTKAKSAETLREYAEAISCNYETVCKYANCAAQLSSEVKTRESLPANVRELGIVSTRLIEIMSLQSMKSATGVDHAARHKLGQVGREVGNVVAVLLESARHGNRAFRQAQESLVCTSNIILDLESAEIFAQSGNLDPLDAKDHFSKHKESLLMSAKSLTDAVQNLSNAAHSNQDELIRCFNNCTQAATILKDKARESAISITSADNHMQQKLLAAAKTVAESLQTLIQSSSVLVSQRQNETTHREAVDQSTRTTFASIASLVQITKVLSDEAMRGERALDGAIEEMDAALTTLNDTNAPVQGTALPAEVMNIAKQLVTTTANLVSSIQLAKQDELVSKAGILRKQVNDLARTGKAAAEGAPAETKLQTIHSIHAAITATKQLLICIKTPPSSEASPKEHNETIQNATKNLAQSLNMVISSSQQLIPSGYVDSTDPNVIAERELLSAALAIEAASKKLACLKPQESARGVNQDLNFDQQILEAAKAIAAATCALVKSATHAQREIVASRGTARKNILGRGKAYFSDGTWSNGLVSAAKQVAQSTAELCEAANNAVKDKCEMEMVSVKAKAVATSTAQLISAAAANSEVHSQSQIGLKAAGKAVTHATDQLVKAAQDAGVSFSESDILSGTNLKDVGSTSARVMEMDAQVSILKMEKELEKARAKLAAVRKEQSSFRTSRSRVPKPYLSRYKAPKARCVSNPVCSTPTNHQPASLTDNATTNNQKMVHKQPRLAATSWRANALAAALMAKSPSHERLRSAVELDAGIPDTLRAIAARSAASIHDHQKPVWRPAVS